SSHVMSFFFHFNVPPPPVIYTLSLHDALPILTRDYIGGDFVVWKSHGTPAYQLAVVVDDADNGVTIVVRGDDLTSSTPRQLLLRSEEHTSELQSLAYLVCRLLLEKKKLILLAP